MPEPLPKSPDALAFGPDQVTLLAPAGARGVVPPSVAPLAPFAPPLRDFVAAFSRRLALDPRARASGDVVALAHWLRPRALDDLAADFLARTPRGAVALPRGLALHFAPGNVDTLFVYSTLLSVLAGNRTLIRLASRSSEVVALLLDVLNATLTEAPHAPVADRLRIVRYPRAPEVTFALSAACDLRVIWGGDEAVRELRAFPLPPRACEVTFPDRWSLAVLDAAAVLAEADLAHVARAFVRDAFSFDQLACASPRLVVWHGPEAACAEAAARLWPAVAEAARAHAPPPSTSARIDKLVAQCSAAIAGEAHAFRDTGGTQVSVAALTALARPHHDRLQVGGGLFWEGHIPDLDALVPLLDGGSQTIATFGVRGAQWDAWVRRHGPAIDRVVPLGEALQFEAIWDGHELLRTFTRLVTIRCGHP